MSECGNCDGVSKIWRVVIFVCIHGYVLYRAIIRYILVKEQIQSQLFGLDWDKNVVDFLLLSVVISLFFSVLCLYSYIQKTGHLANDGLQLKRDSQRIISLIKDGDVVTVCPNTLTKVISFPTSCNVRLFGGVVHLLCAYALLLPSPWIIGEQIKHQVEPPDYLWQTDLSFLFPPHPLTSRLNKFTELHDELVSDNRVAAATLFSLQPPALGGLGQLPQTEKQLETATRLRWIPSESLIRLVPEVGKVTVPTKRTVSVEFINFVMAGLIVCVSLPTVFWHLSTLYSCITSFLLGITFLHLAVDYASTSLLIQYATCLSYAETSQTTIPVKVTHTYEKLLSSLMLIRSPVHLPVWLLVLLTGLAFLPYLINIHLLYAFGLSCLGEFNEPNQKPNQNQYDRCRRNPNLSSALSHQSGCSLNQSLDNSLNRTGINENRRCTSKPMCSGFATQTSFTRLRSSNSTILAVSGIVCLILSTGIRVPVECDLMRVYWENGDPLCLTSMALFIINILAWLLVWISLTLRRSYIFISTFVETDDKESNDNLITSFDNENTAFIRCNGDITMINHLPISTTNSVQVPIFLDGEGVLYSAVQMPKLANPPRSELQDSPLIVPCFNKHFGSTRKAIYRQNEDENISAVQRPDETVSSFTQTVTVKRPQFNQCFDSNGTIKRSNNSQKTDVCESLFPLNGTDPLNAGEQILGYESDAMLKSTITGFPLSNEQSASPLGGTESFKGMQTRSLELVSTPPISTNNNHLSAVFVPKEANSIYVRKTERAKQPMECQYSTQVLEGLPQSRFSPSQCVSFQPTSNNSYLTVPQTEIRTDSSDSGDSACKLSENPDCLASTRSYQYNLATLESRHHPVRGQWNINDANRPKSPVTIPPPISSLSSYLYDPSNCLGYSQLSSDTTHQWNETHGLIVIPTPVSQSTFLADASLNQSELLFEGKLSSQV